MKQILSPEESIHLSKALISKGKKIVLTGGCFDILHPGHFMLLEKSKTQGDILFVLLESDKSITEIKGQGRPIHAQKERASMLAALRFVDYVIMLPYFSKNGQYDNLITQINPAIITTTKEDPNIEHKKRQAKRIGGKVLEITKYIPHKSTTRILQLLSQE